MAIMTGSSIAQTDINYLEGRLSVTFPKDYQDFLKKYNGFRVMSPDYCDIPFDKVDNGFISFDALFGHQANNKNFDILELNEEFLDELSFIDGAIIIGIDPSDNCYVFITRGDESGVYYWDRTCLHTEDKHQDYAMEGEDEFGNLYFVEKTFTQFFEKIMDITVRQGMSISTGL